MFSKEHVSVAIYSIDINEMSNMTLELILYIIFDMLI